MLINSKVGGFGVKRNCVASVALHMNYQQQVAKGDINHRK